MPRFLKSVPLLIAFSTSFALAQVASKTAPANATATAERAVQLAESGGCQEALPLLTKSVQQVSDKDLQKRVGLDGVRCASPCRRLSRFWTSSAFSIANFHTIPKCYT